MQAAPEHAVPAGPLAVRWLAYELEPAQAGALGSARVEIENAGASSWRGLSVAYHWLDDLGNALDWDGLRTAIAPLAPGERTETDVAVRGTMLPARYRLAFDVVHEYRYWLAEIGNERLEFDVEVGPRDRAAPPRTCHRGSSRPGVARARPRGAPAGLRRRRRLDRRGPQPRLRAYGPGGGRNPSFTEPLVCPSLLQPLGRTHGRGPAGVPAGGRRALDLRRGDHSSTAIRSSTRLKTKAPGASANGAAPAR